MIDHDLWLCTWVFPKWHPFVFPLLNGLILCIDIMSTVPSMLIVSRLRCTMPNCHENMTYEINTFFITCHGYDCHPVNNSFCNLEYSNWSVQFMLFKVENIISANFDLDQPSFPKLECRHSASENSGQCFALQMNSVIWVIFDLFIYYTWPHNCDQRGRFLTFFHPLSFLNSKFMKLLFLCLSGNPCILCSVPQLLLNTSWLSWDKTNFMKNCVKSREKI